MASSYALITSPLGETNTSSMNSTCPSTCLITCPINPT